MHKKLLLSLALVPALVGCANHTKCLGTIGGTKFYRVSAGTFGGPNFSALVTQSETNGVQIQQVFGGPGLGGATISAVGHVGAAAVLGTSFPKNVGDNVVVSGGNSAAQSNASASGSGSSTSTGGHFPPGLIDNPGHSK